LRSRTDSSASATRYPPSDGPSGCCGIAPTRDDSTSLFPTPLPGRLQLEPGVEGVPQPVAQEVEAEHHEEDHHPGVHGQPGRGEDEILRVLHLIHQSLKPGGRLLAVTPNGLSPFGGATRYWDFSHETGFTPASWRQVARITGFGDIQFEEYGPIPHSLSGRIRTILWSLVRLGLKLVAYIEVGGPRDISCVYTADMKVIAFK